MELARPAMDFGFGFDDPGFSDRVLLVEVIPDSLHSEGDSYSRKRKINDLDKENDAEVKTLNVNSLLLAASSPFFYKLFQNGMKESRERNVTIKVSSSDEAAFMDILKFIYTNTLSEDSPDVLHRLIVADRFEVISCIKYCSELLKEKPMVLESALSYLELPASVSQGEVVQPLIVAAKKFLVEHFSDLKKFEEEAMTLPLCAVEALLSGDGLRVHSEDFVFNFILNWARTHYPESEERKAIITDRLVHCLCFPYMSCSKLKEVFTCADFAHEKVSKLVMEALCLKVDDPYLQQYLYASEDAATTKFRTLGRIYTRRPVKVMQLEFPQPRCVVFFNLKKEECENLQSGDIHSQDFNLGGIRYYLKAKHCTDLNTFSLYLGITDESKSCTVDYEFALLNRACKVYVQKGKGSAVLSSTPGRYWYWGVSDMFCSWADFMHKDSTYFTDGILHLRVDLTLKKSSY